MADSINSNQSSFASDLKNSLLCTAVFTAPGAIGSVIRNKGIRNTVSSLELENFKKLNLSLKNTNMDVFTRSVKLGEQYDIMKNASKEAASKAKELAKMEKKLTKASAKNSSKLIGEHAELLNQSKVAQQNLSTVEDAVKNGKLLTKEGGEIVSAAVSSTKSSFGKTAKTLFKSELKNKIVLGITVVAAVPRIIEEVIPTFKEKGMVEGMKAAGKVAFRTAADFVSNAGFSAVGRTIGAALGSVVPGIGNAIGGLVGDAIGSCISMRLTSKIFDKNKSTDTAQDKKTTQQTAPVNTQNMAYSRQKVWSDDPNLNRKINKALSV